MMEDLQLEVLRDLAIDHLPLAQRKREQVKRFGISHNEFYMMLLHATVSARASAGTTAVEYAAANLLEAVMLICCERDTKLTAAQHRDTLQQAIANAKVLCELTGQTLPWLDHAATELTAAPAPAKPSHTRIQATSTRPPSMPEEQPTNSDLCQYAGRFLTTEEAAKALGKAPQTLRSWASKQNGLMQPSKLGKHNRWSGDTICELLKGKNAS